MTPKKILVVEDEAITAMDIKRSLEMLGFNVVSTVSRGNDAVLKTDELRPDLILMDIVLKGDMDGIEAANIIKERFDIPVVYLTAHSDDTTFERAKLTEPYGFVIKPINHHGLKSTIETALYKYDLDKKLREREKKFQMLYHDAPLPYQSLDESGNIIEVNPAWLNALGYSREDVIGKWFGDFLESNASKFKENFPKFKVAGEVQNVEYDMKCNDGSIIAVEFNGKVSYDKDGKFLRTHCIFQEITKRKKMEEVLQFQADILNNVKNCIIVYDLQGSIIYWNKGAEEVYGYLEKEVLGQSVDLVYPIKNESKLKQDIQLIIEAGECNGNWEGKRKDGSKVVVDIRESLMHDTTGEVVGIIGISSEINDN